MVRDYRSHHPRCDADSKPHVIPSNDQALRRENPTRNYGGTGTNSCLSVSLIGFRPRAYATRAQNDDQKVKDYGVELATTIVKSITEDASLGIRGVHFCTLNLEKSVRRILDALGWTHESQRPRNQIIDV